MKNLRCKFIVLFLICSGSLFSQTYSLGNQSKWNQLSNVLVSCDLNLLKDNRYYILLSVGTSELVQNIFPSYGFFIKKEICIIKISQVELILFWKRLIIRI